MQRYPAAAVTITVAVVLHLLLAGCNGESPVDQDAGLEQDHGVSLLDGSPGSDAQQTEQGGPTPDTGQPPTQDSGGQPQVVPPLGSSSKGSGGGVAPSGKTVTAGGVSFVLIVPSSYQPAAPCRMMIVYSGTEGASMMANNLLQVASYSGLSDVIFAVLDGKTYFGDGQAGAKALDHVRSQYNIDNDRTFLLSESAGTSAGLKLGFALRQSYFAAFWANDVNASAAPLKTAAQLGFAPWGNSGPGGQLTAATTIVNGMKAAGYRLPADAPYSGPGSTTHGSTQQFLAALAFFKGKSRK